MRHSQRTACMCIISLISALLVEHIDQFPSCQLGFLLNLFQHLRVDKLSKKLLKLSYQDITLGKSTVYA